MTSANAIFTTRNKLFLRSLFFNVKRTIVSKFPKTIKTASITKALHKAIPSVREEKGSVAEEDVFKDFAAADIFSIAWYIDDINGSKQK